MPNLSNLPNASRALARRMRAVASRQRTGGWEPITDEDEAFLAAEYDRARGYDRPREERAKEAYQAALDAPQITWTPTSLRHHAV